jgi:hypothetical protein
MIAFIPGLCPFDDIIIWILVILFPAFGFWLKRNLKWCKKDCKCTCHDEKSKILEKGKQIL